MRSLPPKSRVLSRFIKTLPSTPESRNRPRRRILTLRRLLPEVDVRPIRESSIFQFPQIRPLRLIPLNQTMASTSTGHPTCRQSTSQRLDSQMENVGLSLNEKIPIPTVIRGLPMHRIFEVQRETDRCMNSILALIKTYNNHCSREELLQTIFYHSQL